MAYGIVGIWPVCAPQEDCLFCIIFVTFALDVGSLSCLNCVSSVENMVFEALSIDNLIFPYLLEVLLCEMPCAKSMGISR